MQSLIETFKKLARDNNSLADDPPRDRGYDTDTYDDSSSSSAPRDRGYDTDTYEAIRDAYENAAKITEEEVRKVYPLIQAFNQIMGALDPLPLEARMRVIKSVRILIEE